MKKTLLISCFALFAFSSQSQTFIDHKDPFTGEKVKAATVELGGALVPTNMQFGFFEEKGKKYIMLNVSTSSRNLETFIAQKVQDFGITAKMGDESIVKFKADTTSSIETSGNTTILRFVSSITDEQLEFMSKNQITILSLGTKEDIGVKMGIFIKKTRMQVLKAAKFMVEK